MLLLPWFLMRWGVKRILMIGMAAWTLRYALFAFGDVDGRILMLYSGILLHGVCYDFFFVTGQIFVDQKADVRIRAAAQGFIAFVTLGIGWFIGSWVAGQVVEAYRLAQVSGALEHDWRSVWIVPAVGAALVLVLFAVAFRPAAPAQSSDAASQTA